MKFRIKDIILWPVKDNIEKKVINFNDDFINVIVGDSQTGKSAIIPIIDYCLGSGKCSIPVGPIREFTSWFGIRVQLNGYQMLLVRRSPQKQAQSSLMYYKEGEIVEIPEKIIENNTNVEEVGNRLNQLFKLPNIDFSTNNNKEIKPYEGRPSYKDFLAFCFQPQHIIANPYTLFYKADTIEHRFKLQMIFPLALGLIKSESLTIKKRIKELEDELRVKKRELDEKKKIVAAWEGEFSTYYVRCIELGLLKDVPYPEKNWKLDNYIVFLKDVPNIAKANPYPIISSGTNLKYVKYISTLNAEENRLLEELEDKKLKLKLLNDFSVAKDSYSSSIDYQNIRLEVAHGGWLEKKLGSLHNCPFCGNKNHSASEEVENLLNNLALISSKTNKLNISQGVFDKERFELEKQISESEKEINNVRIKLQKLNNEIDSEERKVNDIRLLYRFVGRIEIALENIKEIRSDSNLLNEIHQIEEELSKYRKRISDSDYQNKLYSSMKIIGNRIVDYKEVLRVENYKNITTLDITQLTLKIKSSLDTNDYLWEIGSGSNWLGYHIATLLSLHEFFLNIEGNNYTPSFIVLDQPTQTYFPEGINDEKTKSDDIKRVNSIFNALSNFFIKTNNQTQIIVLEHAGSEYWGEVENITPVGERWNQDNDTALIPKSWMN